MMTKRKNGKQDWQTAKMGFLTDDNDLRDKILKVSRRQMILHDEERNAWSCNDVRTRSSNVKAVFECEMSLNMSSRSSQVNPIFPDIETAFSRRCRV